jgi:toluene monooxygenase system protein D
MATHAVEGERMVGPVLRTGEVTDALIEAIKLDNPDRPVEVIDRGGYIRVAVPGRCIIRRQTVEAVLGREFRMPGELEVNLSSFAGQIQTGSDEVVWYSGSAKRD